MANSNTSNPPQPRTALRDLLRAWTPPAGPDGFEGLVTRALASVTGYTFRLARSGSQFGRDASTPNAPFAIAMEAKRYTTPVSLAELAGKSTLAAFDLADDIDVWALAATVEVGDIQQRYIEEILERAGITLLTLDWTDAGLPPLGVLLALAAPDVLTWSSTRLSAADQIVLADGLADLATDPAFGDHSGELLAQLSPALVGLDAFRLRNAQWCERHFTDRRLARREFSQFLAPLEGGITSVDRPRISDAIEQAVATARQNAPERMVAVLGGEGSGKSWAATKWWVTTEGRPILLLSVGQISDHLASGDEPLDMLARLAAHQQGHRDDANLARWRRRLERWSTDDPQHQRFVILLDGLNETSGKAWAMIIAKLVDAAATLGGIVIATCRKGYWDREIANRLPFIDIQEVAISDYDDAEFAEVLRIHDISVPTRLDQFMRNPRICALALTLLPQLTGIEDLTVERLLSEYWRARLLERGDLVGHDDVDFANLLMRHAREYRERPGTNFDRDEWRTRSGAAARGDGRNIANDLSDIEEGRFFHSASGRYHFREEALPFALGLLVADELRQALTADPGTREEPLDRIIDPVRGFDSVTDILTAAVSVAALDANYPDRGVAALVSGWMALQNLTDDAFDRLLPILAARPGPFLDAFETGDSNRFDDRFLPLLLTALEREPVAEAFAQRIPKWLGTWCRATTNWGDPGGAADRQARKNAQIDTMLAQLSDEERAFFDTNCPESDVDLGLAGVPALYFAGRAQAPFARAIVAFAFAHTIAGDPGSAFEQNAWAICLNRIDHGDLAAAVRAIIEPFTAAGASPPAQAAAANALRLLGLPGDRNDIERLDPRVIRGSSDAEQNDPLDPDTTAPEVVPAAMAFLNGVDPNKIWTQMSRTSEDYELERRQTMLARFDAGGVAAYLDRIAATISKRTQMPLRQLSWHLPPLSPILSADTVAAIVERISDIGEDPSLLADEDRDFVTAMLVEAVMPHLGGGAQLDLIQCLPAKASFYFRYQALVKPVGAGEAAAKLAAVMDGENGVIERTLLLLAASAAETDASLRQQILLCLRHDAPNVRAAAAHFVRAHPHPELDDAVIGIATPDDNDRSWWAAAARSAISTAIARRRRIDLIDRIPIEHLDWVAAALPEALPRLADVIEVVIGRLSRPIGVEAPHDAIIQLEVGGDDSRDTIIDLVDRGEPPRKGIEAFREILRADENFDRRRELIEKQFKRFMAGLETQSALFVVRRPQMYGLGKLAENDPEQYAGWLQQILAIEDERLLRQLQNLGFALAQNYAAIDAALAARTFVHLWAVEPHVTVVIGPAQHAIRDFALFAAAESPEVDALRERAMEEALDDARIEALVLAAEANSATEWLDAFVEARAVSTLPADQALALTVASFRTTSTGSEQLLAQTLGMGFIGVAAIRGLARYRRAAFARHWFQEARAAQKNLERWRFIELAVAAADRRAHLTMGVDLTAALRALGGDIPQRLKKAGKAASDEAHKLLYGSRKPTGLMAEALKAPFAAGREA